MIMQHLLRYPAHKPGKKLIIRLDPSSLSGSNCDQYFEFNNLMGMIKRKPSSVTEYGQAVHICAAELQRKANVKVAQQKGMEYYLNSACDKSDVWWDEGHLMKVLQKYCVKYWQDDFTAELRKEEYAVELPFALPFMVTQHCEVLLTGVIDSIGTRGGVKCIKDIKTTRKWSASRFIDNYRRAAQFKVYAWALKQMGWPGNNRYAPVLIDLVFLSQDAPFCKLERSAYIDFTNEEIDDTMQWVWNKAKDICNAVESGRFLKNPTCCALHEDGCQFAGVCWGTKETKEWEQKKLVQRVYDPSKFGEVPVIWNAE